MSVQSGLAGQADIAVGNVVGSNIFNVLAVLGLAALIAPLMVQQQLVRLEVPLVVGLSVLVLVMALDGRIGPFDGLLLVAGLAAYTVLVIRQTRREVPAVQAEYAKEFGVAAAGWLARLPVQIVLVLGGLGLLVLGATWLVDSAVSIARALEISEAVIGLTIVAASTSFPELATSVVAAMRGERDIAVGNVVGSSLFNLLGILGVAALVTPGGLSVAPGLVFFDTPRDDCGGLCLPADLRHRAPDCTLGGSFVPGLLRGLRNISYPCQRPARRASQLRFDHAGVRPSTDPASRCWCSGRSSACERPHLEQVIMAAERGTA
ncbi:MAG: hypothetical protein KatS3mg123_2026 [Burkholderiales bacterium]|nr:MAG: hypothetical protein KatS3mg123_2026 [Burkholderiales bacterium]